MLTEVRSVPTFKRLDWMTKQFNQFFATVNVGADDKLFT
jgi:hypothetical protein